MNKKLRLMKEIILQLEDMKFLPQNSTMSDLEALLDRIDEIKKGQSERI